MKTLLNISAVILLLLTSCEKENVTPDDQASSQKNRFKSYSSGTNNGYFWALWTNDGSGYVNYTNGSGGNYAVAWSYTGNFTCGKGYSTGSTSHKIGYNVGAYTNTGGGTLGWYGWSRSPYYEFYVNEMWGTVAPTGGTYLGTLTSDGGTYNVYTTWVNNTNIDGTTGFRQIYSSRTSKNSTGANHTITFANHYNKWKSLGYTLGTLSAPVIMVTESWGTNVSGYSNVTIWSAN